MKDIYRLIDEATLKEETLWQAYLHSNLLKVLVDKEGFFIHVNVAWTKHLGWTSEELTSCPFIDFVHPEDKQRTIKKYHELDEGQDQLVSEFVNRYKCKDGSYLKLRWIVDHMASNGVSLSTARIYE